MNYHNITKDDMLNGYGLRVVLWVSGCNHGCSGCHNPITWDSKSGLLFDESAKKELFYLLSKDYVSGITLSGGDPLYEKNREDIGTLILEIKKLYPQKTIWIYTGFKWEEIKELPFISLVDVIVDGKFEANLKDAKIKWCGSSNQRIIDVKETLTANKIKLWES